MEDQKQFDFYCVYLPCLKFPVKLLDHPTVLWQRAIQAKALQHHTRLEAQGKAPPRGFARVFGPKGKHTLHPIFFTRFVAWLINTMAHLL